ncbi:MAG: NAD-dependent succinate-semialdehyde dehydrogenase [Bacteroidia bacterium]|nr:MAG: NAD-dependent succinate-semialdehyde dehydrogenase [Bacteroidia bacterium]
MPVLKSINPFNPSRIINYPQVSDMNLALQVGRSHNAFAKYQHTSFKKRAKLMKCVSAILRERSREFGEAITSEMGKPVGEAEAEVRKCAWVCDFYAEHAEGFLKAKHIETEADESMVIYEPLGPVLAVMPWNFPFWQVFRFAAPALMAGNTVLLKHASNVQGCAGMIESIFSEAGYEEGIFQNLAIGSDRVASVIANEYVRAVTLTGSEQAGVAVATEAGRHLKKCVLELGGNNAFVVLNDANQDLTLNLAIPARMQNGGQSCIAAKRFILESWIAVDFVPRLISMVEELVVGDPMEATTQVGPLVSVKQAKEVEGQVAESIRMGAKLLLGGKRLGPFYEPTVLAGITPGMPVFDEEVFGPVFAIMETDSPQQALEFSNQSRFGLGVQLFTQSESSMALFVKGAREGAVFINAMVKSDPRLPFGGTKRSGYGRELSEEGIKEFVNIKTVWIG